jgi:Leucine-rich repeat (LRR) protein
MPQLRILNLEGSMLFSLRDLGCDLSNLAYLNISRCGLKSLDGTNGLPNLTEIVVDFNLIEDAGPCSNLLQIRKISMVR